MKKVVYSINRHLTLYTIYLTEYLESSSLFILIATKFDALLQILYHNFDNKSRYNVGSNR